MCDIIDIREQLNANRKKTTIKGKRKPQDVELLAKMQVAVDGEGDFHKYVGLLRVDDHHYFINYNKELPPTDNLFKEGFHTSEVPHFLVPKILTAMLAFKGFEEYHLNPYTFLVTHCLTQGIDIVDLGYILT